MTFFQTYLIVVGGIALSMIIPIIKNLIKPPESVRKELSTIWEVIKPYLLIGLFSVLTGLLVLAFIGYQNIPTWEAALLAGYAWDSTVQKIGN